MNRFALLLVLATLSGCAEMVSKTYNPTKGGTIRYSTGWFMAGKNRDKATDEMKAYCSPNKAILLAEDNRKEFTGESHSNSTYEGNSAVTNTTQSQESYVYLHFRCSTKR